MSAIPARAPTSREEAHRLLELVPDEDVGVVTRMLRGLVAQEFDPILAALDNAPEDDEPVSLEESEQVRRGVEAAARGETIPDAEFWRKHDSTAGS